MKLKELLTPDAYCESIYDYDFAAAKGLGMRLVLYDIDNTMVPHGAPADKKTAALFKKLDGLGIKYCAVSNNKEPRVRDFCLPSGSPYIYKAGKPAAKGYKKALGLFNATAGEAVFFGDQIFTDIIGAKKAGIGTVLVKPVDPSTDEIQIKLKRIFEKPFVKRLYSKTS